MTIRTALLAAAGLALAAAAAQAAPVRIATEGAYAPFNFVDDNGEVAGFDIAVGNEVCKRAELDCVWVKNDWDSIIPNLVSGNYDAIMAGMSVIPERKESIAFSDPYFPAEPSAYVALSDDVDIHGVVSAQAGTVQADYVAESGATLVEFATIDEAIAAVRNGEADAAFGDKAPLVPVVEQGNDLIWVGDEVKLDEGIGIGLRKSDAELQGKVNAALAAMKADGTLNALIHEYFGEEANGF